MPNGLTFFIGGTGGSFDAVSSSKIIYDPTEPFAIQRIGFNRDIYGRATSSYLLWFRNTIILIDGGSGLETCVSYIASRLAYEKKHRADIHFLFTHGHGDHTRGLNANTLFFNPGITFHFHGPNLSAYRKTPSSIFPPGIPMTLRILQSAFDEVNFPVTLDMLHADRYEHCEFNPGDEFCIDDIKIRTLPVNHPGGCVAYRFVFPGRAHKSIAFGTDFELERDVPNPEMTEFYNGAELAFVEMQYTEDEYDGTKGIGAGPAILREKWGHSTPDRVLAVLRKCRDIPKELIVVHHDPQRDDLAIRAHYERALIVVQKMRIKIPVFSFGHGGEIHHLAL